LRIVVIGNSGGGKSTLARRLAGELELPVYEVDKLLWDANWELVGEADYTAAHSNLIGQSKWVIDGLGRQNSIASRLASATHIVLVDFPLWQHYWLAAKRELDWLKGETVDLPAGLSEPPPTKALFETIWTVDRNWLPEIRDRIDAAEKAGTSVFRLRSADELNDFRIAGY